MFATKTELAIDMPTRLIEKRRYFDISGTWNEARGVMPDTSVRKKVSTVTRCFTSEAFRFILVRALLNIFP